MWTAIFLFEVRYQLRQPLFYLVTAFISLLIFLEATQNGVGRGFGQVHLNAPTVIIDLLTQSSLLGLFVVIAFVAGPAVRDFDRRTSELFFSKPMPRLHYLWGRFAGGLAVSLMMFLVCAATLAVATLMPGLDPELVGPFLWQPYAWTLVVMVLPTLFCLGAVAFALAGWTRSLLVTYLAVVGLFAANTLARMMASGLDSKLLGRLLDPFGIEAFEGAVEYWTVAERNSLVPSLSGPLLYNRLLWVGLGGLVFGLCVWTFDASRESRRRWRWPWRWGRHGGQFANALAKGPVPGPETAMGRAAGSFHWETESHPAEPSRTFSPSTTVTQFISLTRFEILGVFRSVPFLGMLLFGLAIVVSSAASANMLMGTGAYPVTHLMVQAIQSGYSILLVIMAILYSGELIWKERAAEMSEVYDATPTSNGVFLAAKLVALGCVMICFLCCGAAATIGFQLWNGFTALQPGLYVQGLLIEVAYPVLLCVLACFFQIIARSKFMGYGLMIFFMLFWDLFGEEFGFEHHLYRFGSLPQTPYSDLNGYGHFLTPFLWFALYWSLFSVVLLALSSLFWKRGTETSWRIRWATARRRGQGPARILGAAGALGCVVVGGWIFYNTNVLNDYVPGNEAELRLADYETAYGQHRDMPLPRIQAVTADVDIYPHQRRLEIRGKYRVLNENDEPIRQVHVSLREPVDNHRFHLPPHEVTHVDDTLGYFVYTLHRPLLPGDGFDFEFELTVEEPGFVNHGSNHSLVANGTYLDQRDYFPIFGYDAGRQLSDRQTRRQLGLTPVDPLADVDDLFARRNTPRGADADWIDFETTVSTADDQVALAPGSLQGEWIEGDRRYFHYKTDVPIPHHFAYLSAAYEVTRDVWNGIDIEIYHHGSHTFNIDRMLDSVRQSLAYFSEHFSPYPYRQVRIVEFPRYTQTARAFPNTIAFSESMGFLSRVDSRQDIDVPFYVIAHELAHQWWSHQVIGGNVQGVAMLAESLAQYSALMVMEAEYGAENMRRFLEFELHRYLKGRGEEPAEELPLMRVDRQDYIYYHKGSLAMYALKEAMGESQLNRALAEFVAETAFQDPPFTTTVEWLDTIRRHAPQDVHPLIDDLFERITLFDNKMVEATYSEEPDGTYRVRMEVAAKKLRADGQGVETEVPLADQVDVAVFGAPTADTSPQGPVLFLDKRPLTDSRSVFEVVVPERPARAGVDPFHHLIDRNSNDNVRAVVRAGDGKG